MSWAGPPPADNRVGEVNEGQVIFSVNLVANLQASEQIMPAVATFHHPASGLEARVPLALLFFLAARLDVGDIAAPGRGATNLRVVVAFVVAEMLSDPLGRWSGDHDGIQGGAELFHVVPVGARERDGQGDAIGIGEHVPLGAQFTPIGGVFSGLIPPLTGAATVALSMDWKRQSMPLRSS